MTFGFGLLRVLIADIFALLPGLLKHVHQRVVRFIHHRSLQHLSTNCLWEHVNLQNFDQFISLGHLIVLFVWNASVQWIKSNYFICKLLVELFELLAQFVICDLFVVILLELLNIFVIICKLVHVDLFLVINLILMLLVKLLFQSVSDLINVKFLVVVFDPGDHRLDCVDNLQ